MQIYTQNLNHARKNMIFFKKSTSQQVNESTSFGSVLGLLGSVRGLFRVCKKKYTDLIH